MPNEGLRVLICTTADLRVGSGSEIRGRLLALELRRRGVGVGVLAAGVPGEFDSLGIRAETWRKGRGYRETIVDFGRTFRPDVLYGITEGAADAVLEGSWQLACASAFDLHGIGLVEILELGGGHGPRIPRLKSSVRWLRAIRRAEAVTIANPTMLGIGKLLNRNATLIAGAVDLDHFRPDGPRVELGPAGRIQAVYAGNFLRWQGCDLFLEAARLAVAEDLPFDFTAIGSFGRDPLVLRRWASLLESGRVRLLDSVAYDDVPRYLRGADVLVIPRPLMLSTHLAFPNKLPDYMAMGRAVLATDLAPHRYAIEDGVTGILCGRSARDILAALSRLRDPGLRKRLGENARAAAETRFDAKRAGEAALAVLRQAAMVH